MKILPITIFLLAIGCPSNSVSDNSDNDCKGDPIEGAFCTEEYAPVCGIIHYKMNYDLFAS